jgi:hypothetical protein
LVFGNEVALRAFLAIHITREGATRHRSRALQRDRGKRSLVWALRCHQPGRSDATEWRCEH